MWGDRAGVLCGSVRHLSRVTWTSVRSNRLNMYETKHSVGTLQHNIRTRVFNVVRRIVVSTRCICRPAWCASGPGMSGALATVRGKQS